MSASVVPAEGHDLVQDLVQRLHAAILSGTFPIGSRLRQEMLAERFGVSRTPVREALRVLQAMGVVVLVPQRGAVVRGSTATDIREAYAVRAELEGLGAQLAAERAGPLDRDRLVRATDLFDAAARELTERGVSSIAGQRSWAEANDLFHEAVLTASGNGRLTAIVTELHRSFPRSLTWGALHDEPSLVLENVIQHQRVRVAIERGDSEASRRWMSDHVRRAGELVADWFDRSRPGGPLLDGESGE
jgi:DNA-binding GntR family transcriptional regulator